MSRSLIDPQLVFDAAQRAARYVNGLTTRPVRPDPGAVMGLSRFDVPFPNDPLAPANVLEELDTLASPATMGMSSPRFFGFVIGGSLPAALAANWLATAWDQNTGLYNSTPATAVIEQVALGWVLDALDLPREAAGALVTGTSVAHVTALAAARRSLLLRAGWDADADGLFGAPPITVIASEEAHFTLFKALGIVGLGRNRVVRVPVDRQGAMRLDALPSIDGPTIVCVQAGNVNTGSFDPIREICERVKPAGAWVHVDGAFGLWARATDKRAHLADGAELADSWATDAHKWLNVPYDSGIAFVRDPAALRSAMTIAADYLPIEAAYRNPSEYTPELSRRARGVDVWAALRSLGRTGVAELVDASCRQARRFADRLSAAGYEILNDVQLNQVLVSFGGPEVTNRVIADLQADGTCWCGGTVWQGRTAMRISVSCWATTDEDVEQSVDAMIRIANEHTRETQAPHSRPSAAVGR
jgi:glutamate/tyrosine decarboxylase-like PLP-dependent enzyme